MKPLHLIILGSLVALASCSGHDGWTVEGTAPAGTAMVYLDGPTPGGGWYAIDSVAPAANGAFKIEAPRAKGEIYRVVAGQMVTFVPADSTETITLNADGHRGGSTEALLFNAVDSIVASNGTANDMIRALDGHLASMAAYYATQRIDNRRLLQTVANRHSEEIPDNPRTQVLLMRYEQTHSQQAPASTEQTVLYVPEIGYYDISLPGRDGKPAKLSDVVDANRVVVLAFSDFERAENSTVSMLLGEAQQAGAAIYEVGFDRNEHLWHDRTAELPWVNVYQDENASKQAISQYFVTALPALFIIVDGEIKERVANPADLKQTLNKYL